MNDMNPDRADLPPTGALQGRTFFGVCPRCGQGPLFTGFLTVAPRCPACDLDYSFADSGGRPPSPSSSC